MCACGQKNPLTGQFNFESYFFDLLAFDGFIHSIDRTQIVITDATKNDKQTKVIMSNFVKKEEKKAQGFSE